MRVTTGIGEISAAVPSVDNGLPSNDVPAKTAPELAGVAVRLVMQRLRERMAMGEASAQDAVDLLAEQLEEIESKSD
jgi:hypothetical protein